MSTFTFYNPCVRLNHQKNPTRQRQPQNDHNTFYNLSLRLNIFNFLANRVICKYLPSTIPVYTNSTEKTHLEAVNFRMNPLMSELLSLVLNMFNF